MHRSGMGRKAPHVLIVHLAVRVNGRVLQGRTVLVAQLALHCHVGGDAIVRPGDWAAVRLAHPPDRALNVVKLDLGVHLRIVPRVVRVEALA